MMSSEKFKDSFRKMLSTVCEDLLPPSILRSNFNETFDAKISKEKTKNVRDNAIKCFKELMEDEFKKCCNEYEIEEKLLERESLIKEQNKRPVKSGWRPTGEAEVDTFGDRRKPQKEYIENLKELAAELEQQLKVSKKALEKEQTKLTREIASCNDL